MKKLQSKMGLKQNKNIKYLIKIDYVLCVTPDTGNV